MTATLGNDRRKENRREVSTPVSLGWRAADGSVRQTKGVTRNLSDRGVYCFVEEPVPLGQPVDLVIVLRNELTAMEPVPLHSHGTVVRGEVRERGFGLAVSTDKINIGTPGGNLFVTALEEGKVLDAEARRRQQRDKFSTEAAERLRAAEECRFSFLPKTELARVAGGWYEACGQAMLRGNYGAIEEWTCKQARLAATQGFELDDLLQLLRLCRRTAIELEGWKEDIFMEVDGAINEALRSLRLQVPWKIREGLNFLTATAPRPGKIAEKAVAVVKPRDSERRTHPRSRLRLPIRIRGTLRTGLVDELSYTENVARGGIYFVSRNSYDPDIKLAVTYPYWDDYGAINREYSARVVRIDSRPQDWQGVAVQFLVNP